MKTCLICEWVGLEMKICPNCKGHVLPDSMLPHPNDDLGISAVGEKLYMLSGFHDNKMPLCKCRRKDGE